MSNEIENKWREGFRDWFTDYNDACANVSFSKSDLINCFEAGVMYQEDQFKILIADAKSLIRGAEDIIGWTTSGEAVHEWIAENKEFKGKYNSDNGDNDEQ